MKALLEGMDKIQVFLLGLFAKVMPEKIVFHKSCQSFALQLLNTHLWSKCQVKLHEVYSIYTTNAIHSKLDFSTSVSQNSRFLKQSFVSLAWVLLPRFLGTLIFLNQFLFPVMVLKIGILSQEFYCIYIY